MLPGDVARLREFLVERGWSVRRLANAAGVDKNVVLRLLDRPESAPRMRADNARALLDLLGERVTEGAAVKSPLRAGWQELPAICSFFEVFVDELARADAWLTFTSSSHTYFEPEPMRVWHQARAYRTQQLAPAAADERIATEGRLKPAIRAGHAALPFRHRLLLREEYFAEAFRRFADWADAVADELRGWRGHTSLTLLEEQAWRGRQAAWGEVLGLGPVENFEILGDDVLVVRPFSGHSQLFTRDRERIRELRRCVEAALDDAPGGRSDVHVTELATRRRPR